MDFLALHFQNELIFDLLDYENLDFDYLDTAFDTLLIDELDQFSRFEWDTTDRVCLDLSGEFTMRELYIKTEPFFSSFPEFEK